MRIAQYATTVAFLASAHAAEPARPFQPQDYPPSLFLVSEQVLSHGSARIHIAQAKGNKQAPRLCRAWLSVSAANKVVFQRYFADIDAVGFSFGLFVPEAQVNERFVAVVKIGDYDGRLYLIRDDGKTLDLDGGLYFVTQDQRFLFSVHSTDAYGLTVFDLKEERVVFSMKETPDIIQWYAKDRQLFFTSDWPPLERPDVVTRYDFFNHRLVKGPAAQDLLSGARKVAWAFDPRNRPDCHLPANPALQPTPAPPRGGG